MKGQLIRGTPSIREGPRWRSCRKKTAYASEAEAEATRQYFDEQVALAFSPRVVYRCRFDSGHWHIGHEARKS
jgi:hypothetical protein